MTAKKIWAIVITAVLVIAAVVTTVIVIKNDTTAEEIDIKTAEEIVNSSVDAMANTDVLKLIAEKNYISVDSLSYGNEKDIILDCTVTTVDVHGAVSPIYNELLSTDVMKYNGMMYKTSSDFRREFQERFCELINELESYEDKLTVTLYETADGVVLYAEDEVVNSIYGGVLTISEEIMEFETYTTEENGETVTKEIESGNVNKGIAEAFSLKRNSDKPDTSTPIIRTWNGLKADFHKNFIEYDRWQTILKGLWTTIKLTIFSLLIGIAIGFIVAFIRVTYIKSRKKNFLLKFINLISQAYLTVIRGTPVVVQIMIIYFVIFMPMGVDKFLAAVICFGLNSGAYVAEIVRGGIMSVDDGQTEAGRSLGFGYLATMYHIVLPQAFKAVLPALANEFVVLLKETSIAFYIGLGDLMYAGNAIRAATYSAFMPLVAVAIIYFIMVLILSKLVGILERKLRNNER